MGAFEVRPQRCRFAFQGWVSCSSVQRFPWLPSCFEVLREIHR